ncbi:MAG: hypothetical protein LLG06_19885 [Desulfobacteraceae bacterium]|nr:hypothetical protein [Desulfobacteraceae bacterium]
MKIASTSVLIFGMFVAALGLIPAQYSHADSVTTERRSYSSGSDMDRDWDSDSGKTQEYKREYREYDDPRTGTETRKYEEKTYRSSDSDLDFPPSAATEEYTYKSERRESAVAPAPPPVVHERDTIIVEKTPEKREGRLQAWWHRNFHRHVDEP